MPRRCQFRQAKIARFGKVVFRWLRRNGVPVVIPSMLAAQRAGGARWEPAFPVFETLDFKPRFSQNPSAGCGRISQL